MRLAKLKFPKHRPSLAALAVLLLMANSVCESPGESVDKVRVINHERMLQLFSHGRIVKTYKVALGAEPVGAKQQQGDHRTPEGS